MNDIKSTVIQAAIEVFSQYGVKKTTMMDIANRAGVSRQTLYVNFDGKDEMLAAAMQAVIDDNFEKLEIQWDSCKSVEDILAAYFDIAVVSIYELLKSRPDAKDLLLGVGEVSNKVAIDADKKKVRMLTRQLSRYEDKLARSDTSAKAVALLIVSTTGNLKHSANSRQELKELLQTFKQSILALVRES